MFRNIFNPDSPLMITMSQITDCIFLSLLWLLCCFPVITLGASCAALLNSLKYLAGIDDEVKLIAPEVLKPIMDLKLNHLGNHNPRLHTDEILIALSMSAVTDPMAEKAMEQLSALHGSEVHSIVVLASVDDGVFKKLGVNVTWEPVQQAKKLYHK